MKTASLENSKALYDRGVRLDTYFEHVAVYRSHEHDTPCAFEVHGQTGHRESGFTYKIICPAPIFEEIAEVLPREYERHGDRWQFNENGQKVLVVYEESPVDALCKWAIFLLEKGHLKVEDGKVVAG